METQILIRAFQPFDTEELIFLFKNTVRTINSRDYAPKQILAWAPDFIDLELWRSRFTHSFTFLAELEGKIVGFANLESNGKIDMFYVAADSQRVGIGAALMAAVLRKANSLHLGHLSSEVSITARPFFEKFGFKILSEQSARIRGETLKNFKMAMEL